MSKKKNGELPEPLKQLKSKIDMWRKTRKKRCAMPESLWTEAVDLTRNFSVNQVSGSLGIRYYGLKDRVESKTGKLSKRSSRSSTSQFVEMPLTPNESAPRSSVTDVEIVRRDGTQVRLRHTGDIDVARLVDTICSGG